MEVQAGCAEPVRGRLAARAPRAAACVLAALAGAACAQDAGPLPADLALATPHARSRLELSANSLPLFDSVDGASRSSRLDMIWLPPRRPSLGLALGLTSTEAAGLRMPGSAATPSVDLGLHWRYPVDSQYRIDITAWRRVNTGEAATLAQSGQAAYGARLEMQIKSTGSGFVAERGFLGLQLESGARITLRRSGGRPMLYYRTRF